MPATARAARVVTPSHLFRCAGEVLAGALDFPPTR